uniref:4-alpha-glucanotransferase n=1 Tax=uncultured Thiotrichaceae bacterium TaxID=298394 RepID=A0A6S6TB51_9GAMM|nr:MAG: 4-alpha-glucanotransferase (amylomaltase) (EC [uncultured Thiotrichaceae bacterium]
MPQQNLSPYQCYSAFAMNPALLSYPEYADKDLEDPDYLNWFKKEKTWLEDYALFIVLKNSNEQRAWSDWDDAYKYRNKVALERFLHEHYVEVSAIYWQQFCLYKRWNELRAYAHERDILLFGDMPIFVAYDSADVWCNPESFLLDEAGQATVVAGVPPDYFSETGQRWGNPHYNWAKMQADDFSWWLSRIHNHLSLFDLVRIDHFRGLEAVWVIPSSCETAIEGQWKKTPGDELLAHLKQELGQIPIVAEDLGIITPEVNALREKYELPGMSVLQFSFDGFEDNPHKPKNITYDRIVYTGTHDNDTTQGWFDDQEKSTQAYIREILGIDANADVVDAVINQSLATKGQLVVIPLQDFLGFDTEARMNIPGVSEDNWTWQFAWDDIPEDLAIRIKTKLSETGRLITSDEAS